MMVLPMYDNKALMKWALEGTLDRRIASNATKKGHKHQHRPTYKPPKSDMSPAEWKRMMRKRRARGAA